MLVADVVADAGAKRNQNRWRKLFFRQSVRLSQGLGSFMNRLWLRSSVLLLCLVQLTVASRISRADDRASGEKLFPKDTLIFFSIPDVPEMGKSWDKSSAGQLLRDREMQPFLEDVHKQFDELSKKAEDKIGVSLKDLLELPQGEVSFALMEKPERKLAAVLLLEYGDKQETVDKLIKKLDDELEKDGAEHSTEEVDDVTLHIYTFKNGPDSPINTLTYFSDESCLVFSNEVAALKEVLERWDGSSDDTLAQNDQFAYIMAQCKSESGDPALKVFLNPIGLINSGVAVAQASIPQAGMALAVVPMLGLDAMKGWGGTMDLGEGDFDSVYTFFFYNESSKGLMGLFNFPAGQLAPPKWVPASVGSFSMMNWNVAGAYSAVEGLVDGIQGRGATARFLDQLANDGPMIHVKKDVLDHLDGKIHVIQNPPKEVDDDTPPIPEFFVALGLKDPAKMKKTLAAAAKAGGAGLETREFNGETIYEISPGGSGNTFSIAVTEGQAVFTNDTPLLENMMRGKAAQRAALADAPEYKKIAKYFPSKTSSLSFQRTDSQLKMYYNLLKKNADSIDAVDVSKLPSFDVIAKYFQASGGYMAPDKKGAKMVNFSLKRSE